MARRSQRVLCVASAIVFALLAVIFALRGGPAFVVVGYIFCAVVMVIAVVRTRS